MKKKYISIGDIHNRDIWKILTEYLKDKNTVLVFLGDFVDGAGSDEDMIKNLEDIIFLARANYGQVILLLGNHDAQYLFQDNYFPGYRSKIAERLHKIYWDNRALFKVAFQVENYLFTHAGVSSTWFSSISEDFFRESGEFIEDYIKLRNITLADILNEFYLIRLNSVEPIANRLLDFEYTDIQSKNDNKKYAGGPLCADLSETRNTYLRKYHHIVGHTKVQFIATIGDKNSSITYCDVLTENKDFLIKYI